MAQQGIHTPAGMGGLMRYSEEYNSRLKITPNQVVIFIIGIIAFTFVLKFFFPIG
jgi:preprotein translocase subunit Sec61beta